MAVSIDAAALLIYRSAWTKDVLGGRVTREASMAKLFATESAQQVIDAAVQIFGGLGVVRGMTVERLYREIRALRIYEGASEVLKLIIASKVLETRSAEERRGRFRVCVNAGQSHGNEHQSAVRPPPRSRHWRRTRNRRGNRRGTGALGRLGLPHRSQRRSAAGPRQTESSRSMASKWRRHPPM